MGPFNKLLFLNSPCNYSIKHRTKQQTSRQTKPKQNENIQTSKYTRSINYSKKFSFGKIQHNIQWDKFTPFSPIEGQLSYQYWKSDKISHIRHFKCWLRLLPISQRSPLNPGGHKHRYPLSVNPDWQVALFWQWELLSQAFWRRKKKLNDERKMEG